MKHLAIIADGNRRWAKANGLPEEAGHVQGLTAIERCCEWAVKRGVQYLTVYCFSTENWHRPQSQVDALMNLARWYFSEQRQWYVARGIRVQFLGRRDRLAKDLIELMAVMEQETEKGDSLVLTICVDYGGRDEIARAVSAGASTEAEITAVLTAEIPEPDMIFRTGGEKRLSNFLLWQAAYAELAFSDILFPAVEESDLDSILEDYHSRQRKFGK